MTTRNAVRPFWNLLIALFVIGSLNTACKKSGGSGTDVDPRDQYLGTYDGGFRITITIVADAQPPESGTATMTVTKGSAANEIYIQTVYNKSYTEKVTAQLTGATFTVIDKKSDQITLNGNKIDADYAATGLFDKNQLVYNATAKALRNGTQYAKTYEITGTKK